jgi:hypothetical protein
MYSDDADTGETPDLIGTIDELIGESSDVQVASRGDGFEYLRGGVAFAARSGSNLVEFRLGDEIAEAAQRTPDTSASSRGAAWVLFSPAVWDDHALDRLEAWFRVAWRLAGNRN